MVQVIMSDIDEELDSKVMQDKQNAFYYTSTSSTISRLRPNRKVSHKRSRTLIDQLEELCLRGSRMKRANTRKTQEPCLRRVNMIHNSIQDMDMDMEISKEKEQNEINHLKDQEDIVEVYTTDMIPYSYAQYEEVTNRQMAWQKQNASLVKAKSIYSFLQDASVRHQYPQTQESKGNELIIYRSPQLPIDLSIIQQLSDEELSAFKQLLGKDVCQEVEKQLKTFKGNGSSWEKKKQKQLWTIEKDQENEEFKSYAMMENGYQYDSFSYIDDDDVNMDLDLDEPTVPHSSGIISHSEWFQQSED